MKSARSFSLVLVTAPNLRTARLLAKAALQQRLAACVNVVPTIESHYWWQKKIEQGSETLLLFKTSTRLLSALEKLVLARHPYDTPEFVVLSLNAGSVRYLEWLAASVVTGQARLEGVLPEGKAPKARNKLTLRATQE